MNDSDSKCSTTSTQAAPYKRMIDHSSDTTISLSNHFSWLGSFIKYLPMSPVSSHRSWLNAFGLLISCSLIIFRLALKIWWNIEYSESIPKGIMYILYEIAVTVSCFLSMYYFHRIFDHSQWLQFSTKCSKYDFCCIQQVLSRYNLFIQICFALIVVIGTGTAISREIQYEPLFSTVYWIYSGTVLGNNCTYIL